jgi:hypothetical protein
MNRFITPTKHLLMQGQGRRLCHHSSGMNGYHLSMINKKLNIIRTLLIGPTGIHSNLNEMGKTITDMEKICNDLNKNGDTKTKKSRKSKKN